jgi:hypothetical protein
MIGTVENPDLAGKIISGLWFENEKLKDPGLAVIQRARFTCKLCGFSSRGSKVVPHGYMVPVNRSHPGLAAVSEKGAECLCPICAASLAINWAVVERTADHAVVEASSGSLIWLPEMPQSKISLISTYILVGVNTLDVTHPLVTTLSNSEMSFRSRSAYLSSNIQLYKDDCDSDFAKALALLPTEFYGYREEVLGGIRYWPNSEFWAKQSNYWYKATYEAHEHSLSTMDEV